MHTQAESAPVSAPDILRETVLSVSEACKLDFLPCRVERQTIWRWMIKGVRGRDGKRIRLQNLRIGGRHITSAEAMRRFFAATTADSVRDDEPAEVPATPPPRTPKQRRRASESAGKQLEKLGI